MHRITTLLVTFLLVPANCAGQDEERKPISALELSRMMTGWEKQVKARVSKDEKLKALAAKHNLAFLHCDKLNVPRNAREASYSFRYESARTAVHKCDDELIFYGDPGPYLRVPSSNDFLVRLPKADFEKNVDPASIAIDDPGILTDGTAVVEGDVFLFRVRDSRNDFFVVIQILGIDPEGKLMSFMWRVLPGGRPIVRPGLDGSKT